MKRDLPGAIAAAVIAIVLFFMWIGLILFAGCTPTIKHSLQVEQRVEDLRFPCDICGQPAKMCEAENWYRCERCSRPKVTPKKLERNIV